MSHPIKYEDIDPSETKEWLDSLQAVYQHIGIERVQFLLQALIMLARQYPIDMSAVLNTPYINTLPADVSLQYPGDLDIEKRIEQYLRWNAMTMVLRAGKVAPDVGGHIATYASAATLYEVGFNHFFNNFESEQGGDLIYIQGHSSPGIYARAYLEGRLSDEQLNHFRQEVGGKGISSYPHPWLMPDFWQFATVSMGLGPIMAIYQARFLKYLQHRGLAPESNRKVWTFCGDGEMDEPESLGAITVASREHLDNLIFVINCNLQRLDGPVRGNGKIVQELERVFTGAGWHVIKVLWGSPWDPLFDGPFGDVLQARLSEIVDGELQNHAAHGASYMREHFFTEENGLAELGASLSDADIDGLLRGGHDPIKVYQAYQAASVHRGQPVVILAQTVKGYGMGAAGEGQNIAHQQKKMDLDSVKTFRDRFDIPVTDKEIEKLPYVKFKKGSTESDYLSGQRKALGGWLPKRRTESASLPTPELTQFKKVLDGTGEREISTTMAFVRIFNILLKDKNIKEHIVPIVPDESRTFGMEGLFRQVGIYSSVGQNYNPVDKGQVMYYREDKKGQILEEGLSEGGAQSSWIAAGTSYSNNDVPMIPFYIFYSMFGFQRVGDLIWAAGDMQSRGFLFGATAGRTTLAGEGLQHCDGHSHILASTYPSCHAYDPTYGYELAVIMQDGLKRMVSDQENIFYYITLMNENYVHPSMPKGIEDHILKGMYLLLPSKSKSKLKVRLLGSGTILNEVIKAKEVLENDFDVATEVWSVTSFSELRKAALSVERSNRYAPSDKPKQSHVANCLNQSKEPIIAATDYMRAYADMIRPFVDAQYVVLGTDGFGLSDSREQLRHYFEVDCKSIVHSALYALHKEGNYSLSKLQSAMKRLGIDPKKPEPMTQ